MENNNKLIDWFINYIFFIYDSNIIYYSLNCLKKIVNEDNVLIIDEFII